MVTVPNGSFKSFFALLQQYDSTGLNPVVQLNHPDIHQDLFYKGQDAKEKKKTFNDYGIDAGDLGPDYRGRIVKFSNRISKTKQAPASMLRR